MSRKKRAHSKSISLMGAKSPKEGTSSQECVCMFLAEILENINNLEEKKNRSPVMSSLSIVAYWCVSF